MTSVTLHRTTARGLLSALDKLPKLTKQQFAVLDALTSRRRHIVPVDTVIEDLWGGSEDGGPLYANLVVKVRVHQLRKLGFPIVTYKQRGITYAPVWGKPAKRKARRAAA